MKNLKDLNGVKVLSKNEQKTITGGLACRPDGGCPYGSCCVLIGLAHMCSVCA